MTPEFGKAPLPVGGDSPTPMADIHDIKPAIAFADHWPWWIWLVIVLAVAALAALIWWLLRRRGKASHERASAPALPPEVEALHQLDALAAQKSADPKLFYFALSAILRRYVEGRYDFPAAEMTSEELLPRIQRLAVGDELTEKFKYFCRSSDPVKFADAGTDPTRMGQDLAFVRQFVEKTTAAAIALEARDTSEPATTGLPIPQPKQLPHPKETV
jgi:hypothetical protein